MELLVRLLLFLTLKKCLESQKLRLVRVYRNRRGLQIPCWVYPKKRQKALLGQVRTSFRGNCPCLERQKECRVFEGHCSRIMFICVSRFPRNTRSLRWLVFLKGRKESPPPGTGEGEGGGGRRFTTILALRGIKNRKKSLDLLYWCSHEANPPDRPYCLVSLRLRGGKARPDRTVLSLGPRGKGYPHPTL